MVSVKKIIIVLTIAAILLIGGVIGFNLLRMMNDTEPPAIIKVDYDSNPKVNSSSTIHIYIDEISGIESCRIYYRVNSNEWISKEMRRYVILCCPPRYLIRLGPFTEVGAQYDFYFEIIDKKNNMLISDIYSFKIIES